MVPRFLIRLLAGLSLTSVAAAGDEDPAAGDDAAAIRQVIADQLAAFRADDFDAAFGFASRGIQQLFRDPGRFRRMVEEGYPMVWRPADVRFSELRERGGWQVQGVVMTDESGALHVLEYLMVEDADGGWRIDGVTTRRPSEAGA